MSGGSTYRTEDMDTIPSTVEVREKARQLVALLDSPEPGLLTWLEARASIARELHKMLGEVLAAMDTQRGCAHR